MSRVSKRGGFSDRNGLKPENIEIQIGSFDNRTRIQLHNVISKLYLEVYESTPYTRNEDVQKFCRFILGEVYVEPVDSLEIKNEHNILSRIKETIMNDDYDDVLTLIEAVAQYWDSYLKRISVRYYDDTFARNHFGKSVFDIINTCFKQEYVGYRFINGLIEPISDETEVAAIEEALSNKYQPVNDHLLKANRFLSDREKPDYENSIKESISAVEALCEILTGATGREATLSNMLKELENKGIKIHGSLKSAFSKLYGYTSDAKGIRHAGDIDGPDSTFEEAKYMLVSCSAFINYVMAVQSDV